MKVSIVMGSKSDLDLAKAAGEILDILDVSYTINILSAHRTPELLHAHIDEAIADGVRFLSVLQVWLLTWLEMLLPKPLCQ